MNHDSAGSPPSTSSDQREKTNGATDAADYLEQFALETKYEAKTQ